MILLEFMRELINNLDYYYRNRSLIHKIDDFKFYCRAVDIDLLRSPIPNTLKEYNFDHVFEVYYECLISMSYEYIFINESREYIAFRNYNTNNDIPIVIEIKDLGEDESYLVLKYGKILLKEIS